MNYQFILLNLCDLVFSNDNGADDDVFAKCIAELGGPSIPAATLLKDRGNVLFKDGNLALASLHYQSALKFLCYLGLPPLSDQPIASSLAFSAILNLAFCELKLSNFTKALLYCSFVLTFDPCNVKALYRRGLASKHLNSLTEALEDFEVALKIDPTNKDVNRELHSLVDQLAINLNGKRLAVQFDPLAKNKKGKKHVSSPEVVDGNDISCAEGESSSAPDCTPVVPMDSMESESGSEPRETLYGAADCLSSSSPSLTASHFNFTNKKRPHNKLTLSSQDYEKLVHGKNLGFYHPRSMSFLRVHTLTSKTIQTGTPHEETSGSAEVPLCSPTPESIVQEEVKLVQEDVVFQVEKKTRLTSASFCVSKVSLVQFNFTAVKEHREHSHSSTGGCHRSHGKAGMSRPTACSKKRSSVPSRVSLSCCRYNRSTTMVTGTKRKEAWPFVFDAHYHRPFKKYRIVSLVTSTAFSVFQVSSSLGGSSPPFFVI